MAENGQQDATEQSRTHLLAAAYKKATTAILHDSTLSPAKAKKVATAAVDAARPDLRAEHTQQLAGVTDKQATTFAAAAVGVLALDLAAFAAVAARGPRWARTVAAAAMAAHTTFLVTNWRRTNRIRVAARAELARGGKH